MNSKGILSLSIILNVAMLGVVGYLLKNRQTTAPPAETVIQETVKTNTETKIQAGSKRVVSVTNEITQKFGWESVESADYKEYIKNLRSIGCPEETIRDIITADVNKLFESRKKQITGTKKFEFWKSGNMFAGMVDEELAKKKKELSDEKKALLKELLGVETEDKADLAAVVNPLSSMLDFLPEEKQSKISELMQSYQGKALKSMKGGAPDAQDMKEMMKVQKEYEAELAKVLTPEEMEDYQLRLSQTSMMMRMQLGTFEPSEEEFREIFKVRKTFDDEFGWGGSMAATKEEREKMKTAQTELNDQLKEILGDRYPAYERSQDWGYQGIVKITERNGLTRDVADKIYEMNKEASAEQKKLREDKTLDSKQREETIKAIKEETQRSIRELMGETAYEAYTNRPGFNR